MARMVALLRGINVGGRMLPMAELRALCAEIGWQDVATYIQSGNVIFDAKGTPKALEAALERAIEARFAMKVPVIVRTAGQWTPYIERNPFPDVALEAPNRLLLFVAKRPPAPGAEAALQARGLAGEHVARCGDGIWVDFPNGIARSKLSPTLIDKLLASPATSRNYRTVLKVQEMLAGA